MKKTLIAAAAAVMMLAAAGAADEKALSSAQEIARYESGGELARDPAEKPVDAPKDMKLILCIGQSNMAGRAKPTEEDGAVVPRAYKLNRDMKWVAAKSPYHFDKKVAAVGPVDDFVKLYLKDHPGESVGVVPCAVGGSPLVSWTPGEKGRRGANLRVALERARAAKANEASSPFCGTRARRMRRRPRPNSSPSTIPANSRRWSRRCAGKSATSR